MNWSIEVRWDDPSVGTPVDVVGAIMLAERDELARQLGLPPGSDDHDVVASAYRRWGDALVDHLRGEFAFVVADRVRRRALLVRDHLGVRPLLYRPVPGGLLASCGMPALLAAPWGRPDVDETYVAHYLAGLPEHDGSVYQGVRRVPAGCAVVVDEDRVRPSRYWRPDLRPTSLSATDAADALREGLERAMAWRLARGSCAVTLSGGLDSTTVYAIGRSLGADVAPYGLSFPGWDCDETTYIEAAAAMYGDEAKLIDGPGTAVHDFTAQARQNEDLPGAGDAGCYSALLGQAASDGRQLILTGFGGDTVLCGFGMAAVDLACHGRFLRARRARGPGETGMVVARSVARFVAESSPLFRLLEGRRWRARRSGSCMTASMADRVGRPATRLCCPRGSRRSRPDWQISPHRRPAGCTRGSIVSPARSVSPLRIPSSTSPSSTSRFDFPTRCSRRSPAKGFETCGAFTVERSVSCCPRS